jgi:hypothetical protein
LTMPTEEERAEMRALDRKLDAFAALLKQRSAALQDAAVEATRGGRGLS